MDNEKTPLEKLEGILKDFWKQKGKASIIAAKHTEFSVEPKIFVGEELNPEILKLLVINYLASTSKQDSGIGNVEATPEKIVIKTKSGKPVLIVRDKKIVESYLSGSLTG